MEHRTHTKPGLAQKSCNQSWDYGSTKGFSARDRDRSSRCRFLDWHDLVRAGGRGEPCGLVIEAEPLAGHLLHVGERHAIGPMGRACLAGKACCRWICVEVAEPHRVLSLWCGWVHREISSFSDGGAALTGVDQLQRNDVMSCGQLQSAMYGKLDTMLETSARLLRLLSLFQARRYWSGAELVERLEITSRTLRRDVDRLRLLGYPVHSTSGTSGGYQLGAGATLPPLLLDDEEAVAVAVGLRTSASGSVTGIEESSVRALAKLEQVLPSRLRRRITALHSFIVPVANSGPTVHAATLSLIAGACRDNDGLRFGYCGKNGAQSERQVEPHRLVSFGRRWYLVAWDCARKDWRTFRVDRIDKPALSGLRFMPRKLPADDVAAYVTRGVAYDQYPHRARVHYACPGRAPRRAGPLLCGNSGGH